MKIGQYGLKKDKHIQNIDDTRGIIYYNISTMPGQSGCPLVFGGVFVGIHNGDNGEQKLNGGRLFDDRIISNILKWREELKGEQITVGKMVECAHSKPIISGNEKLYRFSEKEVKNFPHNIIGAIIGQSLANQLVRGSGVLVSANLMITAAHCIFDKFLGR